MKVHFKDTFNVAVDHVSQKMIGQDDDKKLAISLEFLLTMDN